MDQNKLVIPAGELIGTVQRIKHLETIMDLETIFQLKTSGETISLPMPQNIFNTIRDMLLGHYKNRQKELLKHFNDLYNESKGRR